MRSLPGMKRIQTTRRNRWKFLLKLKTAAILLFLVGKAAVHFDVLEGELAEQVDFGVEAVHVVVSGVGH